MINDKLFEELVRMQREKMLKLAKVIVPGIVEEDLLQPFDFPELERHAPFRYEEGVLEGLLTAQMALSAAEYDKVLACDNALENDDVF